MTSVAATAVARRATERGLVLQEIPAQGRIAVVRLRSLGDTLLTTPALAALHQWRPDLRIAYVVEPAWAPVLAGNPAIEQIIVAPNGWAGRRAWRELRQFAPHLTIDLHGGRRAAWLTWRSRARWRAGFRGHRHAWAHNLLAPPVPPSPGQPRWHTVQHVASLFEFLGLPPAQLGRLQLFPDPAARERVRQRLRRQGLTGAFAYVNAVPRSPTMQWPRERYPPLLRWLEAEHGLGAVMARAAEHSQQGAEECILAALPPGRCALLTGTDVAELIALVAEADLVIGSDGGPLHLAAALGKPTVALFSSTDQIVWGPWQAPSRVVQNPFPCNPCRADRCYAFAEPRCVLSITEAQVRAAIGELVPAGKGIQSGAPG